MKRTVLSAAIGGALILFAGVGTARADDYSKCQDKLSKAQSKVYQEISRHGQFSNQAQKARNKVNDARNWCSDHGVYSTQNRRFGNRQPYPNRNPYPDRNRNTYGQNGGRDPYGRNGDQDAYGRNGGVYQNPDPRRYDPYGQYGPYRR